MKKFFDFKVKSVFLAGILYAGLVYIYFPTIIILGILIFHSSIEWFSDRGEYRGVPRKYRRAIRIALVLNNHAHTSNGRFVKTQPIKRYGRVMLYIYRDPFGNITREIHYIHKSTQDFIYVAEMRRWLNTRLYDNDWEVVEKDPVLLT